MILISGETVRVLLISAREETRDQVGEVLLDDIGDHRFYWVSQPELASGRVQELAPHLILVDEFLNGADPIALINQLISRTPTSAYVALVQEGAMDLARQAMLAGARGFVTKPIRSNDFVMTVRQVLQRHRQQSAEADRETTPDGKVLVYCAPKGGTGRTTLAVNTAITLKRLTGERVAMVDADFASPALDVALNLHAEWAITDLLARLSQLDETLVSSVMASHASGIEILLAPRPGDFAMPISLPQAQQVIVKLRQLFDWVVVDLGLPMDETAFAFLDSADRIVVSVLPEMVGLRNTRLLFEQLLERGYGRDKIHLVLNRATMANAVPRADIEERLRIPVNWCVPDDQPLATHSVNRGVPLTLSHPRSALARAYGRLANELVKDIAPERLSVLNGNGRHGVKGLFARLRRGQANANSV